MPTREQKIEAARLRADAPAAIANTIRCGGSDATLTADEALRQVELRYTLVPKQAAGGSCPVHPFVTLVRGICALCGPQDTDDGGG